MWGWDTWMWRSEDTSRKLFTLFLGTDLSYSDLAERAPTH